MTTSRPGLGTKIAFERVASGLGLDEKTGSSRLFVMRADGTDLHQVGKVLAATSRIAWGPHDDSIAFVGTDSGIRVVKPDGSGLRRLYGQESTDPAWSPDGKTIVFTRVPHGLASMKADGSQAHLIVHPRKSAHALLPDSLRGPAWSPDGTRIAFVDKTWIGFEMPTTIEVANADGSGQRTLVKLELPAGEGVDLTWSADGRSIVFNDLRLEQFGIWIVPSGGGTPRLLFAGNYAQPSWAPVGT